mgnify:CR=1 FL=1|jgi:hypothetical protein
MRLREAYDAVERLNTEDTTALTPVPLITTTREAPLDSPANGTRGPAGLSTALGLQQLCGIRGATQCVRVSRAHVRTPLTPTLRPFCPMLIARTLGKTEYPMSLLSTIVISIVCAILVYLAAKMWALEERVASLARRRGPSNEMMDVDAMVRAALQQEAAMLSDALPPFPMAAEEMEDVRMLPPQTAMRRVESAPPLQPQPPLRNPPLRYDPAITDDARDAESSEEDDAVVEVEDDEDRPYTPPPPPMIPISDTVHVDIVHPVLVESEDTPPATRPEARKRRVKRPP